MLGLHLDEWEGGDGERRYNTASILSQPVATEHWLEFFWLAVHWGDSEFSQDSSKGRLLYNFFKNFFFFLISSFKNILITLRRKNYIIIFHFGKSNAQPMKKTLANVRQSYAHITLPHKRIYESCLWNPMHNPIKPMKAYSKNPYAQPYWKF